MALLAGDTGWSLKGAQQELDGRRKGRTMQIIASFAFLVGLAVTCPAQAGTFNAQCQFVGGVRPQIAALANQFPNGGADLTLSLGDIIAARLEFAPDAIYLALRSGDPNFKQAVGAALARAATMLARTGNMTAAEQLRRYLRCADPITVAAFSYTNAQAQQALGTSPSTGTTPGATGPGCDIVSPTRPGC